MEMQEIIKLAEDCGFTHVGELKAETLKFLPDVRSMCAADKCHAYNKTWSCPPAIGTLEEMEAKAKKYHRGIILQSTGEMEDDFDLDTMLDTEEEQKGRFYKLVGILKKEYPDCFAMSSGACTICDECTYPDAPCRFPEKLFPSMEACGLFVSDVCKRNGMKYNYGKLTMTYTSCILID